MHRNDVVHFQSPHITDISFLRKEIPLSALLRNSQFILVGNVLSQSTTLAAHLRNIQSKLLLFNWNPIPDSNSLTEGDCAPLVSPLTLC